MKFNIQPVWLILFIGAFIIATVIGTLSHEYGHIIIAKLLGYKTTLHYASMNWESAEPSNQTHNLLISIGGPLQTILTGILGLLILQLRKQSRKEYGLNLLDWIAVFLSLFWLREIYNLTLSISKGILIGTGRFFGGDEARISNLLELPSGVFPIIFGVLGLGVSLFVIFKVIPKDKRLTFILGGLIGGISGSLLWMNIIGPMILP